MPGCGEVIFLSWSATDLICPAPDDAFRAPRLPTVFVRVTRLRVKQHCVKDRNWITPDGVTLTTAGGGQVGLRHSPFKRGMRGFKSHPADQNNLAV